MYLFLHLFAFIPVFFSLSLLKMIHKYINTHYLKTKVNENRSLIKMEIYDIIIIIIIITHQFISHYINVLRQIILLVSYLLHLKAYLHIY